MTVTAVHTFAGTDPLGNLAREECLLDTLEPGASALVLYANRPCVVLGKHQNPLREVRLAEAFRRGVPVVRRSSGGGTVWHDEGNLNWSLLVPKAGYDREAVSAAVARALASLGRSVTPGDKGDLFLDGKKVSGSAYLFRRDRVLHHGTLLCRSRLDDLRGVLGPTGTLAEWVGVASRPMPVTNLDLDPSAAARALGVTFAGPEVRRGAGEGSPGFEVRVATRARELGTAPWLWDQTPPFTWEGETLLGIVRVRVEAGSVVEISGRDDRIENMSKMVGKRFFSPDVFDYIPKEEAP